MLLTVYQHIVEVAPQALLVVNSEHVIVLANQGAEQLFGYDRSELVGADLDLLLPQRHRGVHPAHVRSFFEAPRARAMGGGRDLHARRKDGSDVSVEIGLTPLDTPDGPCTLASVIDITERKRHEDALRAAHSESQLLRAGLEQRVAERTALLGEAQLTLQTLLDALPSMIGYWDTSLHNRFANKAYRSWFGDKGADICGKHMIDLLGPQLFEQNRPFIEGALQGKPQTFERAIPRPDGNGVRHSLAHYLPDIVDGQVRGFHVLVHDVTEITESRQRLAQSLKEREVMLQEIHHRVKNNLQVVSSLLNLQVRRIGHGAARDALEDCQRRVMTIALIHEQLYQTTDFSQVHFGEYLRRLVPNVLRAAATSTNISLEVQVQDVALEVGLAIPCALIVNELVTNALKHAFHGRSEGTLRVAFGRREQRLELEVSDDGTGLPKGFDMRHAHSMGLQVVATLAQQIDATLSVAGGNGSVFRLTFPDGA